MQSRNGLFWGIALMTLGVLVVARRAGWLDADWHALVNLWPLLLILAGVNLILRQRGSSAAFITTVMLAVAVPATVFGLFSRHHDNDEGRTHWRWNYRSNDDNDRDDSDNDDESYQNDNDSDNDDEADDDDEDSNEDDYQSERKSRGLSQSQSYSNSFVETMDPGTREAVFKLAGGAGTFTISDPTTDLIKADTRQTVGTYSMSVERDPTTRVPTVELKPTKESQHVDLNKGDFDNRVEVHLNATPVWTMDVALGAGQGELDLSTYAVKNLKLEAGAASLDLKLGAKAAQSDVKVDIGAASLTVRVPKEVGCKIKKDGILNAEELDGFTDMGGGEFVSPGYGTASKKINIRFDGGISHFKVVRY